MMMPYGASGYDYSPEAQQALDLMWKMRQAAQYAYEQPQLWVVDRRWAYTVFRCKPEAAFGIPIQIIHAEGLAFMLVTR